MTDEITERRVDQLAAQLAGLQRLVESLVNERGEGRRQEVDDESRCAICGWPLKERINEGCVRTNCSQRPRPDKMYAPQRFALEQVRFRADRTDADRNQLRAEVTQLTKERQDAISLAESRRVRLSAIAEATDVDRKQLRAEVERLTRERDEAQAAAKQWEAIATGPHGTADDVAETIAAFVDREAEEQRENGLSYRQVSELATAIRAGEWKP